MDEAGRAAARAPVPLTVIGGYLGAGKTTLLNHLLRHSRGRHMAVLVNDFGSVGIDAELIERRDGETISLANGCICCSLAGGFAVALSGLRERADPPEHIVVEASGVADPRAIGQYGHLPGFRLDGVIVVADAETVLRRAADGYVGAQVARQLRRADLIVLNKVDLVGPEERATVERGLRALEPRARVVAASHGAVPLPLLLGESPREPDGAEPEPHDDQSEDRTRHEEYATWSYAGDAPLDGEAFRATITALPDGVLRAKGVVFLAEDYERRFILQLVGKRWSLRPGEPWGNQAPRTRLVLIGLPGCIDEHALALLTRDAVG